MALLCRRSNAILFVAPGEELYFGFFSFHPFSGRLVFPAPVGL
jgi:hypothetical protein